MDTNTIIENTPSQDNSALKIGYGIYISYLIGLVLPVLPLIVGVILAYVFRSDAKGPLVSHYQYMIRTFWIGMLYFVVSALLIIVLVGFLLSFLAVIWWIVRVVIGLKALSRNEPIANPLTWGF